MLVSLSELQYWKHKQVVEKVATKLKERSQEENNKIKTVILENFRGRTETNKLKNNRSLRRRQSWERYHLSHSWRKYPLLQGDTRALLVEDIASIFSCRDIIKHVSSFSWISDRVWAAFAEALRKFARTRTRLLKFRTATRAWLLCTLLCVVNESVQPVPADSLQLLASADAHYWFSSVLSSK